MKKSFKKQSKIFFRINDEIRAPKVRVIGSDGKQVDVMSVSRALSLAKKESLDLVEIVAKANPPVVKIADYGKLRYAEEKKLKEQKRKTKAGELKEIRLSPFIAEQDYQTRMRRISKFLTEGNKVRAVVVFKGRHMGSKPFGYKLLNKVIDDLDTTISVDMAPKFLGRHLAMIISPVKRIKKENAKTENKKISSKKI